jgi:hypothetical protein
MWRFLAGFGFCALVSTPACGGRVQTRSGDPGEPDPVDTPAPSSTRPADSVPKPTGTDNPDADIELGACKLGPRESEETTNTCAWVVDERCYETHDAACNCACPRSHNSQCTSGFEEGPDGHVWVACD